MVVYIILLILCAWPEAKDFWLRTGDRVHRSAFGSVYPVLDYVCLGDCLSYKEQRVKWHMLKRLFIYVCAPEWLNSR